MPTLTFYVDAIPLCCQNLLYKNLATREVKKCNLNIFNNYFFSYYAFDKEVLREFLGKKMNAKLRKDMDDVSEKTGVSLESCRRQVIVCISPHQNKKALSPFYYKKYF